MAEPQKGLLVVAVRVDDARQVQDRIKTVLAVASTYAQPKDTVASVWCKPLDELVAADLDRLAGFVGWDRVRDLNVGDVVGETHTEGQPETLEEHRARIRREDEG